MKKIIAFALVFVGCAPVAVEKKPVVDETKQALVESAGRQALVDAGRWMNRTKEIVKKCGNTQAICLCAKEWPKYKEAMDAMLEKEKEEKKEVKEEEK